MLYDGECPLCMREAMADPPKAQWGQLPPLIEKFLNVLRERNKQYEAIKFVDISSEEYNPQENRGLDYKTIC